MRHHILSRYARSASGYIYLDVAAPKVSDLYEDMDRVSPFSKKDLDPSLAEYLVAGAEDIGSESFIIRIALPEIPLEDVQVRVRNSITNFFTYWINWEKKEIRSMMKTSAVLFWLGVAFLTLATYMGDWLSDGTHTIIQVFPQGITVAGWVALWHATATFLIDWFPRFKNIKTYQRLANAPVEFMAAK